MQIKITKLFMFLWLLGFLNTATVTAGQNILYYFSQPGDYIGQGQEVTFTGTDGVFTANYSYDNGAYISFISPGYAHWWYLNLDAANNALLTSGSYQNTQRFPFQSAGSPGLDFSGDGRGCNTSTGNFDVLEIVRDANNNITQLAANFEQHCEGATPALFGQIRYNSDIPLSAKPISITLLNSLNSGMCVEAANPKGATISVEASSTTDSKGGNNLSYAWSTNTGETGSGTSFSFKEALNVSTVVTLNVTDLTNNSQKTVAKTICVSDTTPPSIVINSPVSGATIYGDNIILDVKITDSVDKDIKEYQVQYGSNFNSPLNPKTGHSRQQIIEAPKADGSISATITVNAQDASGNAAQQQVNVTELPRMNFHH